ncbi:MAG TPA: ABC transporter substrate-binding protein [Acidimicrobiales bacterium]|nr:ABC transporter substrate-binding protein [Acidimicrobiales bacterium]
MAGRWQSSIRRTWRRLRRQSAAVQVGALVGALAIVGGAVGGVVASSGSNGSGPGTLLGTSRGPSLGTPGVGIDQASTSTRGVVGNTINVAFPVANLTALSANLGFLGDTEFGVQPAAIHIFVNDINDHGGIDGKKINPIIQTIDPTNPAAVRALCKQWTEGNPPVFAVLDGVGSWVGDNQLCVAQEGHTPMIGQWTTVTNWTTAGSPYLWWTGADQAAILETLVTWGQSAGLLGPSVKVGIVTGDRTSDQVALHSYLLPALAKIGVTNPEIESMPSGVTDTAATTAAAPLVVQRLESAGVTSVIPLIPFNALFPYLGAATTQNYFPKLLLSDYESSINVALGLIPFPYEKALEGQEGVTVETLGGTDAPSSVVSAGGYDPGVQSCFDTFNAHHAPTSSTSKYIEEQGPIVSWCQVIRLFAAAARDAGPNLNRRTFVQAMSRVQNFTGTLSPTLSYGPNKFYGPTEYEVVSVHNNVPPGPLCVPTYKGIPQGTCWHIVQSWQPLAGLSSSG